jgi:hypothetical protein
MTIYLGADEVSAVSAYSLAQNPNALYAAAINRLGMNSDLVAVLSPFARQIFDALYNEVSALASDEVSAIGNVILYGASELSGVDPQALEGLASEVGDAVSSVVADVAPYAAMIVSNVIEIAEFSSMFNAPSQAANASVTSTLLSRPVQGTGGGQGGYAVTPADIFAPQEPPPTSGVEEILVVSPAQAKSYGFAAGTYYPDPWTQQLFPAPFPFSSFGLCLAALTESDPRVQPPSGAPNDPTGNPAAPTNLFLAANALSPYTANGPSGSIDSTIRHTDCALYMLPTFHRDFLVTLGDPDEPNVGLPPNLREVFQLMRLAIGSRASTMSGDPAVLLYILWMDLFADAWAKGQMTPNYALYSLCHLWGPSGMNGGDCDGPQILTVDQGAGSEHCFLDASSAASGGTPEAWTPYVSALAPMVDAWVAFRKTLPANLSEGALEANVQFLALAASSPAQIEKSSFGSSVRAILALRNYRANLQNPPAVKLIINPGLFGKV